MVGRATSFKLVKWHRYHWCFGKPDLEILKYKFKSWGKLFGIMPMDRKLGGFQAGSLKGSVIPPPFTLTWRTGKLPIRYCCPAETVGMRLRFGGRHCRVIAVSIKRAEDLISYSHQLKIQSPIDSTAAIYEYCKKLFDEAWDGKPIRHLGVRVSDLSTADHVQLSMFEKDWEKQKKIDRTVDQIRMRFGPGTIVRSNFIWSGLAPLEGGLSDDASYPVMTSIL